jgi:nicotinamidase-related amidase
MMMGGADPQKTVLLIIDPQNDFCEGGNLPVEGAKADLDRVCKFIEAMGDKINEIHVTLDTYSENHIGHAGFWQEYTLKGSNTNDEKDSSFTAFNPNLKRDGSNQPDKPEFKIDKSTPILYIPFKDENGNVSMPIYNVDPNDKIYNESYKGSFGTFVIKSSKENEVDRYITPKNPKFLDYVDRYFSNMMELPKIDTNVDPMYFEKDVPMIWSQHCIRDTHGYFIYQPLVDALNKWAFTEGNPRDGRSIIFHEKGWNNLAEMYSVMKADVPYEDIIEEYEKTISGQKSNTNYIEFKGDEYIKGEVTPALSKNFNGFCTIKKPINEGTYNQCYQMNRMYQTKFNDDLFTALCGDYTLENNDITGTQNKLYVCGEAKTHCVKKSVVDILNRMREKGMKFGNMILLEDGMSSISGFEKKADNFISVIKTNGVKVENINNIVRDDVGIRPATAPVPSATNAKLVESNSTDNMTPIKRNFLSTPKHPPKQKYVPENDKNDMKNIDNKNKKI